MTNIQKTENKEEICQASLSEAAEEVAGLLMDHGWSIGTAESCTGGMLASGLIDVPGISAVFKAGFITYSNEAKQQFLNVPEEILLQHGAVSEEVAGAMAIGAARAVNADVAVSVTGIAGPEGGSEEKPVGLVYIGCYVRGKVRVIRKLLKGNRAEIRRASSVAALHLLCDCIAEASPSA